MAGRCKGYAGERGDRVVMTYSGRKFKTITSDVDVLITIGYVMLGDLCLFISKMLK